MSEGERVTIKVREHGPYKVTGPVRLIDADGNEFDLAPHTKNDSIVLCRCGGSKTKPFCDQTHSEIGFCAAERAVAAADELAAGDGGRLDPSDLRAIVETYQSWAHGDFNTPSIFDPEVTVTWAGEIPGLDRSHGLGELSRDIRTWFDSFDDVRISLERVIPAGNRLVAFVHLMGVMKGSSAKVDWRAAHVWTMRDGRCVAIAGFADRVEALRSVGLPAE
jgi:CDGSH iron-sulfur domain-containing protein 3